MLELALHLRADIRVLREQPHGVLFQVGEIERADHPLPLTIQLIEAAHDLDERGALSYVERRDVEIGQALEQFTHGLHPAVYQSAPLQLAEIAGVRLNG